MKSNKGFTLIELLVVVLIIGILAAIAVPQYQKAVAKSKVMSMKPLLRSITEAENAYKLRTGQYTTNLNLLDISMPPATSIDESGALVYSDFSCNTQEFSDNYSIFCTPNKEGFPFLEKYFDQATFHCWANKTELGEKVCQELSGKTTSGYDHQAYGHLYQFY